VDTSIGYYLERVDEDALESKVGKEKFFLLVIFDGKEIEMFLCTYSL
jgi:hypothetical protein